MTDKKPTDSEIVKALDICSKSTNGCSHNKYTCEDCYLNGQPMCSSVLLQYALDLINRLQAEIERLKTENKHYAELEQGCYVTGYKNIKAEAYKEFVNKIKVHAYYIDFPKEHRVVDEDDIDNLLKELEGDSNAEGRQ
jgi:FtsZ-binding cell division protein ZapB